MDQDKGLRTSGFTVTLILLPYHLSTNEPRQRLEWVQSSRPWLQKLAGEGRRGREVLEALAQPLSEAVALQGSLQTWGSPRKYKARGMCVLGYL